MKNRALGPFSVSAIGLGCMNLNHGYGAPVTAEQGEGVLQQQGKHTIPIHDTTRIDHLDALMAPRATTAGRYNAPSQSEVDAEEFA